MQGITTNSVTLGTGILTVSGSSLLLNGSSISSNLTVPTWSQLTWASTVNWAAQSNVYEDRKVLLTTGACALSIAGLYNGWAGVLKVVQSGSGKFGLTLPSGTAVINSGSGIITLTTGVSGAVDMVGFQYDGGVLLAAVGNAFN
jgi:hypothetical protein